MAEGGVLLGGKLFLPKEVFRPNPPFKKINAREIIF